MKALGYTIGDLEAVEPLEFREMTLSVSADELEVVIAFLQNARMQFETFAPTPGQSHLHLRDWWKGWNTSYPDLIVVYDESKKSSDNP
jgi:hypothetical protein